jgi:hypothetical protein
VAALQTDLKNVTNVLQRFIDEHMGDALSVIKSRSNDFEKKMGTLEWLTRYSSFYPLDSVYGMINTFKEIYNGPDAVLRSNYMSAMHESDALVNTIALIKIELGKVVSGGS